MIRVVEKERREGIGSGIEIVANTAGGGFRDEDGAVFLAFAANDKFATVEVDGIAIEGNKLGNAKPSREKKFDDGAVAETRFVIDVDGF